MLRQTNPKANSSAFDKFWYELQAYSDETTLAMDERRHGDVLHMPLAVSIRQLQKVITDRRNFLSQHLLYPHRSGFAYGFGQLILSLTALSVTQGGTKFNLEFKYVNSVRIILINTM